MYGHFIENTAGYEINTLNLPTSWEYIYENKDILLKVDQFGPVYAQANPPGDIMLFKREAHQKYSPWFVNIITEDNERFTNFFRPNKLEASCEPENVKIQYLPETAVYSFEYKGMKIETEIFIPNKGIQIVYKFRVKNICGDKKSVKVRPQLLPYLNDAVIAPWDKYEWYLDTECKKGKRITMTSKLLSANAQSNKRRTAVFTADNENLTAHEISLEKYIGQGDLTNPEQNYFSDERLYAYPPIYALSYEWGLMPGEEKELTQSYSLDGSDSEKYFDKKGYSEAKSERKAVFDKLFSKNNIKTGDSEFDYYANYWIPLQMNWVASLDRGWPTGMRGSRDSAQDYAALLYTDTESCRKIILTMLECQRSDGWFPRQYSAKGKHGKHDLRGHVDGGAFFIEFMWKYLAHTRDFDILNESVQWLDKDGENSVLEHFIQAVEYYMYDENIGEHGLCKIREGDWLDAVNRAGTDGRGESVTVSEQLVMGAKYLADVLKVIGYKGNTQKYIDFAAKLKENINKFAFNGKKYYNGVFNDAGEWIFSENDPDGEERIYSVSNYYAVISGVAEKDKYGDILKAAEKLKCEMGYRLFYPPLGVKPIDHVGRIASGDAPPFMGENANVYNHGSQGFFARALSVMGEGNALFDVLKWITPYDTQKHPTEKTFTPPYAIVNCYQQLPGFHHRGLMCFLTGSVAMAMRGVYEWMLGIKPCLDGLELGPCMPDGMSAEVKFSYMGKNLSLNISNGKALVNGTEVTETREDLITGKKVLFLNNI